METNNYSWRAGVILTVALLSAVCSDAWAVNYQFGDLGIDLQTSITEGIAIRGEDPDSELISKANLAGEEAVLSSAPGAYSGNIDDGDLAYKDAGDLFFAQTKLSSELTLKWNNWAIFARGNYRYDPYLEHTNQFDDFDYGPDRFRSDADKRRRENQVDDANAHDAELFDLYLTGHFKLFGHYASVRVGRQVFNWGESTFLQNGINSIVPVDARQARGPGAEVKEIFRPFGAVYGSLQLTTNLSIAAYYQYDWEKTVFDPSGTYFSTADVLGAGAADALQVFGRCNENVNQAAIQNADPASQQAAAIGCPTGSNTPEAKPDNPDDGGQYGVRFNAFLPWLNRTDLSLYAVKYSSRIPFIGAIGATQVNVPATARFFRVYPEDIHFYGFSFNTYLDSIGAAFSGEYSFKHNQPLAVDDVDFFTFALGLPAQVPTSAYAPALGIPAATAQQAFGNTVTFQSFGTATGRGDFKPSDGRFGGAAPGQRYDGFIRRDVQQLQFSLLKNFGPNWTGANATNVLLETGFHYVDNLPDTAKLPIDAPATFVPNQVDLARVAGLPKQDRAGYADDFSWGYRLLVANTYSNVFNRFNLTPTILFFHDVKGNSPNGFPFLEGSKQLVLSLSGTYRNAWEAGIGYTFFFGSGDTAASPLTTAESQPLGGGRTTSGYTNNLVEDRDFLSMFVRYTF